MKEPEKWIGGRRTRPMAERIEHARLRIEWHAYLWRQALAAGDKQAMERQRIRVNSARRYWRDLKFEAEFRGRNSSAD